MYRALALSAVAAGSLGLLLPVLPTVPFLLVALWAASRGAPAWLLIALSLLFVSISAFLLLRPAPRGNARATV